MLFNCQRAIFENSNKVTYTVYKCISNRFVKVSLNKQQSIKLLYRSDFINKYKGK